MCPNTLCFFRGVSELQHSFLEENHPHTYSLLLSTSEARGGGRNSPPWHFGVLKVHPAARAEKGDASPAPMLTRRAGFEKMSVEFGKEAEICISLIS